MEIPNSNFLKFPTKLAWQGWGTFWARFLKNMPKTAFLGEAAQKLPSYFRACLNFRFAGENGQRKVLRKRFLSRVAALRGEKKANAGSFYGRL
ncbi:hypothetical protein [Rufibacter sp. XAAS-G3-1]|uniref:hypothetical protein n=1 Tax=Rufibacter sp. XAAS-G3-1 TaxID=2729134 RepID=UPI0015E79C62|nr:hypothetical protein [Rufibacter sp. XAAS-G3-1]